MNENNDNFYGIQSNVYCIRNDFLGSKIWYKDNKIHRDPGPDGRTLPAIIHRCNSRFWYKNGKVHRDPEPDGTIKPAIIRKYYNAEIDKSRSDNVYEVEWYQDGKSCHVVKMPTRELSNWQTVKRTFNGFKKWCINTYTKTTELDPNLVYIQDEADLQHDEETERTCIDILTLQLPVTRYQIPEEQSKTPTDPNRKTFSEENVNQMSGDRDAPDYDKSKRGGVWQLITNSGTRGI